MIAERAAVTRHVGAVTLFSAVFAAVAAVAAVAALAAVAAASIAGVLGSGHGGAMALLVGAFVGAASAAAIAVVLVSQAAGAPPVRDARQRRLPRSDVDLTIFVRESHPDAAGHVRARAPGRAAPAA